MTPTRTRIAAALLAAASLAACGGSDGEDAATTSSAAPVAETTSTTAGASITGLAPLDLFVLNWNSADTVGKNTVAKWVSTKIDRSAVTTGPAKDGSELFAVRLSDGASLGGRISQGKVVSSFLRVDKDDPAAASIVQTAMTRHTGKDADVVAVAPVYREVALSAEPTSRFISVGEDDAFVISVVEGTASARVVAISMSNLTDEAAARQRATDDQTEILALLAAG